MQKMDTLLRFYFVTDDAPLTRSMNEQVRIALAAGATSVQYRNKQFGLHHYKELMTILAACRQSETPLIINDNVLLAKAVKADGVHLGQGDDSPQLARHILGSRAIVGLSVSSVSELVESCLDGCDYIGCGPVFTTDTKPDAQPACHLEGLKKVVQRTTLPVVAIGGISDKNAADCFGQGAAGVAVISTITRSNHPEKAARKIAAACEI